MVECTFLEIFAQYFLLVEYHVLIILEVTWDSARNSSHLVFD